MSVSKSETNIPKIRKPFSAELIPRVPYISTEDVGENDTINKLVTPVIVKNREIVEAAKVATKEYVDENLITGEYYQRFTVNPLNFNSSEAQRFGLKVGTAVKIRYRNYSGTLIEAGSAYAIKPLEYTVQHNSLVRIYLSEYCASGGGDVIDCQQLVFNHDKTSMTWATVATFHEKFSNSDETHSIDVPCKVGTKFRFILGSGTIKQKNGQTLGHYWAQPISFEKSSTTTPGAGKIGISGNTWYIPYYIADNPTMYIKSGTTGGITITEFVLSGIKPDDSDTGTTEEPSDTGGGSDPSPGGGTDPVIITSTDIGFDNLDSAQTDPGLKAVFVKNGAITAASNNHGGETKPVYVKSGAIRPCVLADASFVKVSGGCIVPASTEAWTFETIAGASITKNVAVASS